MKSPEIAKAPGTSFGGTTSQASGAKSKREIPKPLKQSTSGDYMDLRETLYPMRPEIEEG